MKYLFQVAIGPVQSFIASARRTRDLWFGSTLLSELSKLAARKIDKDQPGALIFPNPEKDDLEPGSTFNVANKILAEIAIPPEELGRQIKEMLDAYLDEMREQLYDTIDESLARLNKQHLFSHGQKKLATLQIEDLLEYSWVALPYEEDSQYAQRRLELEIFLAARKNTYDYGRVTWGSQQPKSSIDGRLESVIPKELQLPYRTYKSMRLEPDQTRKMHIRYRAFGAGNAEQLSGVDLLKRLGRFPNEKKDQLASEGDYTATDFPSTSHIASLPYLACLERLDGAETTQARERWQDYINKVKVIGDLDTPGAHERIADAVEIVRGYRKHPVLDDYDGGLLFVDRLLQDAANQNAFNEAQEALQHFLRQINEYFVHPIQPYPYYALLQADGDRMGEAIEKQAKQGPGRHRQFSRALATFAAGVRGIVENDQYRGKVVYAGGDDILAFVPVHTALDCARALSKAFREVLSQVLNKFSDEKEHTPTLSVGVAVMHHLSLLNEALETARRAEKQAKQVDGKNALAIIVNKRSGEDYSVAGQWGEDGKGGLDEHLQRLITLYRQGDLPKGLPYEIRETVLRLTAFVNEPEASSRATSEDSESTSLSSLQGAIHADINRILKRKLAASQNKTRRTAEETADLLTQLSARLNDIYKRLITSLPPPEQSEDERQQARKEFTQFMRACDEYTNEFVIAQVFADAKDLADTPKKGENA
jgi:CRISPR-associated protein Cmr2